MVLKMIETARLTLRQWLPEDYSYFAQMSTNPQVMQYFPKLLTRTESDAFIDKVRAIIELQGWGFWAVELSQIINLLVSLAYIRSRHSFHFRLVLKLVGV